MWDPASDGGPGTWNLVTDLTQSYQKFNNEKGMINFALQSNVLAVNYTCDSGNDDGAGGLDDHADDHMMAATEAEEASTPTAEAAADASRRALLAAEAAEEAENFKWGRDDYSGGYMSGALDDVAKTAAANTTGSWRTFSMWHASSADLYDGWLMVGTLRNDNALVAYNVSDKNNVQVGRALFSHACFWVA